MDWTYFLPLKSCTSYSTPTFSLPEVRKLICKVNSAFLLTLHTCQVVNCFQYGAVKPHTSEPWQSSGRLQLTSTLRSQETSVLPELAAVITCLFVAPIHLCKVRGRWWIQPPQPNFISESYLHAQNHCFQSLSLVHCLFCIDNFTEPISLESVVSIVVSESHLRQENKRPIYRINFLSPSCANDRSLHKYLSLWIYVNCGWDLKILINIL